MQNSKIKNGIIILLLVCVGILSTCEFSRPLANFTTDLQDTIFLSQWRREKKQKLELIASYEKTITRLENEKDSLKSLVVESKKTTSAYRFKAKQFQQQLKNAIVQAIPIDSLKPDTVTQILDSLIITQAQGDLACDSTINTLETILANRDSSMFFQKQIETNLRDLNKEQELRNQILTEQLNLNYKNQRKKTRQNKILAGGILILSGITTSLLFTQALK